jgi:two-component system response regulator NreC
MDAPRLRLAAAPTLCDATSVGGDPVRVLLADGHAQMRRNLRLLLDDEEGVEVVAEADDLASVVRHVHEQEPQVLVLDLGIAGGSRSGAIGELRRRAPESQIVVVTMNENPVFAERALAAGAIGFVSKDLSDEELPKAIRLAAHGEQYVSPRVAPQPKGVHAVVSPNTLTASGRGLLKP